MLELGEPGRQEVCSRLRVQQGKGAETRSDRCGPGASETPSLWHQDAWNQSGLLYTVWVTWTCYSASLGVWKAQENITCAQGCCWSPGGRGAHPCRSAVLSAALLLGGLPFS